MQFQGRENWRSLTVMKFEMFHSCGYLFIQEQVPPSDESYLSKREAL